MTKNFQFLSALSFLLVVLYMLPYYFLAEKAIFNIGDNLDSNVPWYKTIAESEHYWSISNQVRIDEFMGGAVLRNHMPGSLKMSTLIFKIFSPLQAYLLNKTLVHLIGMLGMSFLLLRLSGQGNFDWLRNFIIGLVSFTFAVLPSSVIFDGASFVIAPMVLWGTLEFYRSKSSWWLLLLLALPVSSALVLTNLFILAYLAIFSVIFMIRQKNALYVLPFMAYFLGVLIADHQLFISLFANFEDQRASRILRQSDLGGFMSTSISNIWKNKYAHNASMQIIVLLLFIPLYVLQIKKLRLHLSLIVLLLGITNIFIAQVIQLPFIHKLPNQLVELITKVDLTRFNSLNPFFFWTALGLLILASFDIRTDIFKWIITLIPTIALALVLRNSWGYRENLSMIIANRNPESYWKSNTLGFKDYYSCDLFKEVKGKINYKNEYVLSFGIQPGVLRYNGFYTFDGYFPIYEKSHNQLFVNELKGLLNGNELNTLDNWGNRCYYMTDELMKIWDFKDYIVTKDNIFKNPLSFKANAFLGKIHYVISSVPLISENISFIGKFERRDSPYEIYVYKLMKSEL